MQLKCSVQLVVAIGIQRTATAMYACNTMNGAKNKMYSKLLLFWQPEIFFVSAIVLAVH